MIKRKGPQLRPFPVELPGIELAAKRPMNCGNAENHDAKVRETTCGYVKGVDAVNTHRFSPKVCWDSKFPGVYRLETFAGPATPCTWSARRIRAVAAAKPGKGLSAA
jgi:hypothetical protein